MACRCALAPFLPPPPGPALAARPSPGTAPSSRWFPSNRRDGARLLSTVLVISGAGLVRFDHPIGRAVCLIAAAVGLFWWRQYRRLTH